MGNGAGTRSTLARMAAQRRYATAEAILANPTASEDDLRRARAATNVRLTRARQYLARAKAKRDTADAAERQTEVARLTRLKQQIDTHLAPFDAARAAATDAEQRRLSEERLAALRAHVTNNGERGLTETIARPGPAFQPAAPAPRVGATQAEMERALAQQRQSGRAVPEEGIGRALTPAENRVRLQALRDAEEAARKRREATRANNGGRHNPQRFGSLE